MGTRYLLTSTCLDITSHMNTELVERYIAGDPARAKRLTDECSISMSLLKNIRRGYTPSIRVLRLMAPVLGCSVEELSPEGARMLAKGKATKPRRFRGAR